MPCSDEILYCFGKAYQDCAIKPGGNFEVVDIVDPATRSRMMSNIRSRDTKPELVLRKQLHALGFRYSLHRKDLPGKPDLVFRKHRAVIFVHGCFWHRHEGCKLASVPATNAEFWQDKFTRTVRRDRENIMALKNTGWRTGIVWECSLRSSDILRAVGTVAQWLRSSQQKIEYPGVR